jgi:multiple sugar transport system permease protein
MKRKNFSYAKYGYIFSIPFVIVFLVFSLYPLIYTTSIAFTDRAGRHTEGREYHIQTNSDGALDPLGNFRDIIGNQTFRSSMVNTAMIWIINFIPQLLLALLLAAWFTSRRAKIRGQGFFKTVFYMPNIITAATIAILFNSLLEYPNGVVNEILVNLSILETPKRFTADAWASRIVVAFIQFWMWYGYTMLIFIAGIMGINPEMYESADIDGASSIQSFFYITLPNIRTIMLYTLVTSMIGGLNMFDVPRLYLDGGPDGATQTAALFIYGQAFRGSFRYNFASAASLIVFAIIVVLAVIIFYLLRDKDEVALKKLQKAHRKAQKALQAQNATQVQNTAKEQKPKEGGFFS